MNTTEKSSWTNILAFHIIAFHYGFSNINQLALQFYFKDEMGLNPSGLSRVNAITNLSYIFKFLLGVLSDMLPICGYRRKSYLILCALINTLAWLYMSSVANTAITGIVATFFINFSVAFSSVIGHAIVVELSSHGATAEEKENKAKDMLSWYFFQLNFGDLLASYLKGLIIDILPLRKIFFYSSFLPLLLLIPGLLIDEEKLSNPSGENMEEPILDKSYYAQERKNLLQKLCAFITRRDIFLILSFIIFLKCSPALQEPLLYFSLNLVKLTPTQLGQIAFVSNVGTLIAIALYKQYLKNSEFKTIITVGSFLLFFSKIGYYLVTSRGNLSFGIPDYWMLMVSSVLHTFFVQFVDMPIMFVSCTICPKHLEASVFSICMSAYNLGVTISRVLGAYLTIALAINKDNFDNLHVGVLVSSAGNLAPLPMQTIIEDKCFESDKVTEEHDSNIIHVKKEE